MIQPNPYAGNQYGQPQPSGLGQQRQVTVNVNRAQPMPQNYSAPQPSLQPLPFGLRPTIDPNVEKTLIKITLSTGQ